MVCNGAVEVFILLKDPSSYMVLYANPNVSDIDVFVKKTILEDIFFITPFLLGAFFSFMSFFKPKKMWNRLFYAFNIIFVIVLVSMAVITINRYG